nr:MAG TPA: hypothetical protein [Caudoviricetes sp.]
MSLDGGRGSRLNDTRRSSDLSIFSPEGYLESQLGSRF